MKRFSLFEILIAIFFIASLLYGGLSDAQNFGLSWFDRDDAYYYFKVAQNISEGHGSTFDGMNITNGYHPLWLLICIPVFALTRFDLSLPLRILFVLMGLLNLSTSMLLYRWLKRHVQDAVAGLIACYWLFDYHIQVVIYRQGLETGIAAFSLVLMLFALSRFEDQWESRPATYKEILVVALLAVLVMFSRLDLIFLVLLIGFRIVFRGNYMRDLLGADLLFVFSSVLISFLIRIGLPEYYFYSSAALSMVLIAFLIRIPVFYFSGTYEKLDSHTPAQIVIRTAFSVTLGTVILAPVLLVVASALHFEIFPRSALLYDWLITLVLVSGGRLATHWFTKKQGQPVESSGSFHWSSAIQPDGPRKTLARDWKKWYLDGGTYYFVVFGALAVYMLSNQIIFETSSPVSGQVKRWWGSFAGRAYGGAANNTLSFFGLNANTDFNAWPQIAPYIVELNSKLFSVIDWNTRLEYKYFISWLFAAFLLLVFLALQRKSATRLVSKLFLIPLAAASGIQILSYNAGGYAGLKEWYWVTQTILVILLASVLIELATRGLIPLKGGRMFVNLAAMALILYKGNEFHTALRATMPYGRYPPGAASMEVITFLEQHTEPGSIIGMTGGGNVGYFIRDRSIVNMDGLINSHAYFNALKAGTAGDYLANIGLDYVFANPQILAAVPYRGQFHDRFEEYIVRFGGKVLIRYDN